VKVTSPANGGTSLELTLPLERQYAAHAGPRFAGEADTF
jgi:hypothetical protein